MKLTPPTPAYRRLQEQAGALGWACPGSVQRRVRLGSRPLRQPVYQWTRKVKGKTVTVSLTPEQYQRFRQAIANQRRLTRLLAAMQKLAIAALLDETK
jgi:uncharacterized protein DUF6788